MSARVAGQGADPFAPDLGSGSMRHVAQTPETLGFGAFAQSLAIEVPKFHGLEPKLSLQYSSGGGLNAGRLMAGFIGVGWEVQGLPDIVRTAPVNGTPRFDASDVFQFDGKDLIPCTEGMTSPSCTQGGNYTGKVESYERIRHDTEANTWTVWAKDGTRTLFFAVAHWGGAVEADDDAPDLIRYQYRWLPIEREDIHGNKVSYSYTCRTLPVCYPERIVYNNTEIQFVAADHPAYQTRATGRSLARLDQQLRRIEIRTGGLGVRAYGLWQETSPSTGLQRLVDVRRFGTAWELTEDARPAGENILIGHYAYSESDIQFTPGSDTIHEEVNEVFDLPGDFDGDGRQDVLIIRPSSQMDLCSIEIKLSTATGFVQPQMVQPVAGGILPCWASGLSLMPSFGFRLGDFDGDGLTDISIYKQPTFGVYLTRYDRSTNTISFEDKSFPLSHPVATNPTFSSYADIEGDGVTEIIPVGHSTIYKYDGSSFIPIQFPPVARQSDSFEERLTSSGDANGDGRAEVVTYHILNYGNPAEYLATRYRWAGMLFESLFAYQFSRAADPFVGTAHPVYDLPGDLNGDGATDVVRYHFPDGMSGDPVIDQAGLQSISDIGLHVSTGRSFQAVAQLAPQTSCAPIYRMTASENPSGPNVCEVRVIDIDGDGRGDVVVSTPIGTDGQTAPVELFLNRGGGNWERRVLPAISIYTFADLNGDGKPDIIAQANSTGQRGTFPSGSVLYATGPIPDLMTTATSALGGVTRVEYTPSSAWGTTPGTRMPFVTQTVSKITVEDGRGQAAVTTLAYRGGRYDFPNRRFLGFAGLTATLPCSEGETACPGLDIAFSQDFASAGTPIQVERRDGAGTPLRRTTTTLQANNAAPPYAALPVTQESSEFFAGAAKTTRLSRSFDAFGNITAETSHGDVDRAGDERHRAIAYAAPNVGSYIVDKPARVRLHAGDSPAQPVVADTITLYDGATTEGAAPTQGNPTQIRRWRDTAGDWVSAAREYDAFGNLVAETDEVGATTRYTYDPGFNVFVVATTNALGQATATGWNVPCEQPETQTDLNGGVTTWTYDGLCRRSRVTRPGGDFTGWLYVDIGQPDRQYVRETRPAPNDAPGEIHAITDIDGLGRIWRTRGRGPGEQDIHVDRVFDGRGNLTTETLPYYYGAPSYGVTTAYDALDRPVRLTQPDGAATTLAYRASGLPNGSTAVDRVDPLGRTSAADRDAYGNQVSNGRITAGAWSTVYSSYDSLDRLVQVSDPIGAVWRYAYDSLGHRIRAEDPDLGTWHHDYDAAGRLSRRTDARGTIIDYAHDALGRETQRTVTQADGAVAITASVYDQAGPGTDPDGLVPRNVGHLAEQRNATVTLCRDHDEAGRLIRERWLSAADARCNAEATTGEAYRTLTRYDSGGRVTGRAYPDGDGVGYLAPSDPSAWRYDAAGRLFSVPGSIGAMSYDAAGRLLSAAYTNGVQASFTYSATRGWREQAVSTRDGATLLSTVYAHDAGGRITAVTSSEPGENWTYAYDDLDQLTVADNHGDDSRDRTFSYDTGYRLLSA
ncbi:toxin TcdB middle/N-terminal domain-containing protein, partial [Methylorubrum thiocyanatum]|uniref:toxin TcdB middle/N-terminal domain-containing protein n=1 Tax=Methylorubrum thiocyanatum TaxID=47958 RepID=UPI003F807347